MKRIVLSLFLLLPILSWSQGIQAVEVKRVGTNEVLYLATTIRNTTAYPLTSAGLNAFTTALTNKAFSLTVNCPAGTQTVYPVGATLPVLPPCAPQSTTLLSAQYTYNDVTRSLDVEATGTGFTMKIEPVQGGIVAIQSPASQTLSVGQFLTPGPLTGQGSFVQQWGFRATAATGSGIPQLPLRLTWKRTSDNVTFSYVFIPTNGTRKMLFTAGNSSPPSGCDYTLTATGGNAGCGAARTLTATASGTGATGITYAWSGNAFAGTGAAVSVTPPAANGTYTYTVTATKAGCTAKTATADVIVSGCSTAPTTARNYPKVLFWDNSIGFHPPFPSWGWNNGWGMAATAVNKDYRHLLLAKLKQSNAATVGYAMGGENNANGITGISAGVTVASGPDWEASYDQRNYDDYNAVFNVAPDLLVFKIGENVDDATVTSRGFKQKAKDLLNRFKVVKPGIKIVIATPVWDKPNTTRILKEIAAEDGHPVWDGSVLVGQPQFFAGGVYPNQGVNAHPDDDGMAAIANGVFDKIPINSGDVLPPPTPPPGPGQAPTLSGGFAEGSLAQLMALAPFVPDQNQYSGLPPANHTEYLDNGQIRFGLRKSITMGMTHLGLSGGINLLNTFANNIGSFEGQQHADLGRSAGWASYGTPGGANLYLYCEDGQCTGEIGSQRDDTGWNPVQYGNRYGARGVVLFYQKKAVGTYGEVMYTKTQPMQWSLTNNRLGKTYVHCWYWLVGRSVRYYTIHEVFRDDNQMIYEGREQEWPFCYSIAPLYRHLLDTGTGVREVTRPAPNGTGDQTDTDAFGTVGNWMGTVNEQNQGLFLVTPYNSRFRGKQFGSRFGDEFSNDSGYMNAALLESNDQNHTSAYAGAYYVGGLSDFQSWYQGQNFVMRPFEFSFGPGKMCGWYSLNGPSKLVGNQYTFGIGAIRASDGQIGHAKFFSPHGNWTASSIARLYVRGKFTGLNQVQLQWRKSGDNNDYSRDFPVVGDGVERTYVWDMTGQANWNGFINNISIGNTFPRPALNGSETFVPTYIGRTNPGN